MKYHRAFGPAVATLLALLPGCGGDKSPGTLEVRVYGEDFIEQGLPASAFDDGWSVKFDSFLVSVADVSVAQGHGTAAISEPRQRIFDLTRPSMMKGALVTSQMVGAGNYDHVAYTLAPARTGAMAGNSLPSGGMESMVTGGESMRVSGAASKDGKTVRFAWGFNVQIQHQCHVALEVDGGTTTAEITIHADHLFYDDLVAGAPGVRFDLIAASDSDGDGNVTQAELAARDIRGQMRYQVGNIAATNLWAFMGHQASTVGHINGEGHCEVNN